MYTLCNTVEARERNLEESRTSFFLQMQNRIQEGECLRLGVVFFFLVIHLPDFCRRRRRRCCRRCCCSTIIQNRQTDRHLVAGSSAYTGTLPGLHLRYLPAIPDSPIQVCMNHDPARYIHKVPTYISLLQHPALWRVRSWCTYIHTYMHTLPDTVR